jgi:O-antigen/teichoic acid export membrane protein
MVYRAKEIPIQSSIFGLVMIVTVISSSIVFFLVDDIGASLYVLGSVIFGLVTSEFLGTKLYKKYAKYILSQRIMMIVFALVFYFLLGYKGILLGYGLSFLFFSKPVIDGFKIPFNFSLIRKNFKFILNNYLTELLLILHGHIDKLLIAFIFGYTLLGNYQLGFQIIIILGLFPAAVFQYVLPRESSGQNNYKIQKFTIIFSIFISFLVILLAPTFLPQIFPKYTESVEIIQIMSVHIIPTSISLMYTSKFLAHENNKPILISSGIRITILIILIFTLSSMIGINGVALSIVLSSVSQAIFLFIISKYNK